MDPGLLFAHVHSNDSTSTQSRPTFQCVSGCLCSRTPRSVPFHRFGSKSAGHSSQVPLCPSKQRDISELWGLLGFLILTVICLDKNALIFALFVFFFSDWRFLPNLINSPIRRTLSVVPSTSLEDLRILVLSVELRTFVSHLMTEKLIRFFIYITFLQFKIFCSLTSV